VALGPPAVAPEDVPSELVDTPPSGGVLGTDATLPGGTLIRSIADSSGARRWELVDEDDDDDGDVTRAVESEAPDTPVPVLRSVVDPRGETLVSMAPPPAAGPPPVMAPPGPPASTPAPIDPTSSAPPDTRIALLRRSRQRFIGAAIVVVTAGVVIGVVAGRSGSGAPLGGSGASLPAGAEVAEDVASPVGVSSGPTAPEPSVSEPTASEPTASAPPAPADPVAPADDAPPAAADRRPAAEKTERRDRQRYGTVDIYSEPWANIYLGKRKVGVAPQRGVKLPFGRHRLRLVNPVLKRSTWVTVTVPSGRPVRVALPER
jgi:hypothetical protein